MDRVLSSSARILLSWSIFAIILSISVAVEWGWTPPEPDDEPPLLETATDTGDADTPHPSPPTVPKHILRGGTQQGNHNWLLFPGRGSLGTLEDGNDVSTSETTFPVGKESWMPPNCWNPRYSFYGGDRESMERKKQRKQTNKCCKLTIR